MKINWSKFEESLGDSVSRAEYLLARAKAIYRVENDTLQYKSVKAYKAFKHFLKELDKCQLHDDQRISVIEQFNVTDHI